MEYRLTRSTRHGFPASDQGVPSPLRLRRRPRSRGWRGIGDRADLAPCEEWAKGFDAQAMRAIQAALESAIQALPWMDLVATPVTLVGVGYAAIVVHCREWGVVLMLAWNASVGAVLQDVQPFVGEGFCRASSSGQSIRHPSNSRASKAALTRQWGGRATRRIRICRSGPLSIRWLHRPRRAGWIPR